MNKKSTQDQLNEVKALIKAKKYDEAKEVLIFIDHPTADKWLSKLNMLQPAQAVQVQANEKSFTVKLFVAIVLLLFWVIPGIIALAIFAPEAKKYPDAPGAKGLIYLNKIIFWLILAGLLLLLVLMLMS